MCYSPVSQDACVGGCLETMNEFGLSARLLVREVGVLVIGTYLPMNSLSGIISSDMLIWVVLVLKAGPFRYMAKERMYCRERSLWNCLGPPSSACSALYISI